MNKMELTKNMDNQETSFPSTPEKEVDLMLEFSRVKTELTDRPKPTNGAYGLYPVQFSNVIIDGCIAIGNPARVVKKLDE